MEYEEGIKEFSVLAETLVEIAKNKNADYSDRFDFLSNFKMCEEDLDVKSYVGVLIRMGDKYKRACNLTKRDAQVKEEKIEDTLLDLAGYCLLCILCLRDSKTRNPYDITRESVSSLFSNLTDEERAEIMEMFNSGGLTGD